jgi:hypothetical protein
LDLLGLVARDLILEKEIHNCQHAAERCIHWRLLTMLKFVELSLFL